MCTSAVEALVGKMVQFAPLNGTLRARRTGAEHGKDRDADQGSHDGTTGMRYRTLMLLLSLSVLAGCEKTIDPATGQTQTVWTLPVTQASVEAAEQQWQQCVQFASQSYCERTLPDGRPPGVPLDSWSRDNDP